MADPTEINPLELSDDQIDDAIKEALNGPAKSAPESELDLESESEPEPKKEEGDDETDKDEAEETQKNEDEDKDEETKEEDLVTDTNLNKDSVSKVDKDTEIDYKSQYESLFQPFKANGKEMKIDSIEDARTLMQMGANYNKKMAALKPNLKLMKLLEKNDLLNQDKLSFLIDLDKKDPEAIKKLLADSKIDPLDIDPNEKSTYKPKPYTVSDSEVELDSILSEIKDTATFNKTIDIIGNKWDGASQEAAVKQPEIIKIINEQIESGLYDQIMSVVEREKILGRLTGLSDIEAYYQVGRQITANDSQVQKPTQSLSKLQTNNVNKATNPVDPKLASRKKAASSTKSAPRASKPDFNPLSMSDEEFEKLVADKFI